MEFESNEIFPPYFHENLGDISRYGLKGHRKNGECTKATEQH
jgi:hypothetical protein